MNPQKLYTQQNGEYKDSGVYFCSHCRHVYNKLEDAEKCCKCVFCGELVSENKDGHRNASTYSYHRKCWDNGMAQKREESEKRRFESAEKIDAKTYSGWIFSESLSVNEGFCDICDLLENLEIDENELPEYVWACKAIPFKSYCVDDFIEYASEECYDGMVDSITIPPELKIGIEKYIEVNKNLISYEPDYKRAIINLKELV